MTITFRLITEITELQRIPDLERRIWGPDVGALSIDVLVVAGKLGGGTIGAYDGGRIVGFAFGFATRDPALLHSHIVGVHPDHRGSGIGSGLKRAQRDWALSNGYAAMQWTFDPLQVRNAILNFNVLGAVGVAYLVDLYGPLGGINGQLPSDRVLVRWDLAAAPAPPRSGPTRHVPLPDLDTRALGNGTAGAEAARTELRTVLAPLLDGGWTICGIDDVARRYLLLPPAED